MNKDILNDSIETSLTLGIFKTKKKHNTIIIKLKKLDFINKSGIN